MRGIKWLLALGGLLSLTTVASATTCPANTWCFGANPTSVSDGTNYSTTVGSTTETITVYSEQVTNSNNDFSTFGNSTSTIDGLFAVNDTYNDEGNGIAPYDPKEGTGDFYGNQLGISDEVGLNSSNTSINTADGNVLLLELGSSITDGTTLSFLLQAGLGASGDSANFYTSDTTANVASDGINLSSMTLSGTAAAGSISTSGTNPQITLTKNTTGVEWVAIEADCHYLLLDTIKATPPSSTVPEPRFYGLLLASLLGIASVVYRRRRAAQTDA